MDDVFVGSLMSTTLHTVTPETPIQTAAGVLLEHDIGSVVVVDDDDRLEGILTATDFVRITADGLPSSDLVAADSMSTDVITTTANEPIRDAADTMLEHGFHHLPVVDETDRVIGMITTTDLTAYLSHNHMPSPT